MIKICVPATSANLGPGFDTLGMALSIYNTFRVEESTSFELHNVEDAYNSEDNLFIQSYQKACEKEGFFPHPIRVYFGADIPVARGLGSSAACIVGGAVAAFLINKQKPDRDSVFQIAAKMEGHPDNAAPAVYGEMLMSKKSAEGYVCEKVGVSDKLHFCVLIPPYAISTSEARKILPEAYSREEAVANISSAAFMIRGLEKGDMSLVRTGADDRIHEPYRQKLISGFEEVREEAAREGATLLISGSGSSSLLISEKEISDALKKKITELGWDSKEVSVSGGYSYAE